MRMVAESRLPSRSQLAERYRTNRERSAQIFALVAPAGYYERPIPLRHPFAFYEGHIPAFSFSTLNVRALGEPSIDPALERLFERGIDPPADGEVATYEEQWPPKEQIEAFGRQCDERVYAAIANAKLVDESVPQLVRGQSVMAILEHEDMHDETLVYLVHRLAPELKGRVVQEHRDPVAPANDRVEIPAGVATLGACPHDLFAWDNELPQHTVPVSSFGVQRYPVTNGEYLRFVELGGQVPPFWIERDGAFALRGVFEDLPLPLSWPVYATNQQATAYAAWIGGRLMSEAEYHRAAFASPSGEERPFPWGDEAPEPMHGNFDFVRFDPEPVGEHPAGASAWGVHDLVGNGWEWTSSPFAPFDGFVPMASYPRYSVDFFDGKHYVMKGASPVTARGLVRRSFRNWFYGDYPYMYAKFRCVL
jgi:iron(II)-dependent oxidoreductase